MKHYMNWGAILGLSLVVFSIILFLVGQSESMFTSISHLIIIAVLCFAIVKKKESNGGFLSYGEGVAVAAWVSIFAGVIMAFYTFVDLSFIDADKIQRILIQIEDQMYNSNTPDDQIEMVMGIYEKMFTPGVLAFFALVAQIIEGLIIGLIASAVFKKEDTSFEANFK
ncbi:MAG: hypothetical protein RL266_1853 [Bacteroidota bacterium]|jgi:hypothetical protein